VTGLIKYEKACRALAEARNVDEVRSIHDKARQMAAAARVAKNRELEADAFEIRVRAERRLGEMMAFAKTTGDLASGPGRPRKNGSATAPFPATLAEIKIDKKLSSRAQRLHAIPADDFDNMIIAGRRDVERSAEKYAIKAVKIAEAPHHRALDFMRLGWCPSPALAGTHHGADSVLMLWQCVCPVVLPARDCATAEPAA
jgi:hypothetical protein